MIGFNGQYYMQKYPLVAECMRIYSFIQFLAE